MNLDDWRSRINDLDEQILNLLNQRAHAALHIGELKRQQDLPYFVPEREAQVLDRLVARNRRSAAGGGGRAIWREILSACARAGASADRRVPRPAGHLHAPGRARSASAPPRSSVPVRTIAEIFDEVERGRAEFGVVPVENSTEGAVNVTLDRLLDYRPAITRRADAGDRPAPALAGGRARRDQAGVLAPAGAGPVPRSGWPRTCPTCATEETASTAAAAERARDDPTVAAIASELAAGSTACRSSGGASRTTRHNSTRFLVLGRRADGPDRARQDVDPVLDEERARRALPDPRAVRAAPGST